VPLFPLVPALSLLTNAFLVSSLPASAFVQYALFLLAAGAVYLVYAMPARGALHQRQAQARARGGRGAGARSPG
jgi:hypothetical protein